MRQSEKKDMILYYDMYYISTLVLFLIQTDKPRDKKFYRIDAIKSEKASLKIRSLLSVLAAEKIMFPPKRS